MLQQSNTQLNTCRVRTGDQWSMEHRLPLISEFIGARCSGLESGKENQAKREVQFRLILRKFAEGLKERIINSGEGGSGFIKHMNCL